MTNLFIAIASGLGVFFALESFTKKPKAETPPVVVPPATSPAAAPTPAV